MRRALLPSHHLALRPYFGIRWDVHQNHRQTEDLLQIERRGAVAADQ